MRKGLGTIRQYNLWKWYISSGGNVKEEPAMWRSVGRAFQEEGRKSLKVGMILLGLEKDIMPGFPVQRIAVWVSKGGDEG